MSAVVRRDRSIMIADAFTATPARSAPYGDWAEQFIRLQQDSLPRPGARRFRICERAEVVSVEESAAAGGRW
jgi:hypothetical protein